MTPYTDKCAPTTIKTIITDADIVMRPTTTFSSSNSSAVNVLSTIPSLSATELTLMACVRQSALTNGFVFANSASAGSDRQCLGLKVNGATNIIELSFNEHNVNNSRITISSDAVSNAVFVDDFQAFHSLTAVVTFRDVTFYIDGSQYGQVKGNFNQLQNGVTLCPSGAAFVGKRAPDDEKFDGSIRDMLLFREALSVEDIIRWDCIVTSTPTPTPSPTPTATPTPTSVHFGESGLLSISLSLSILVHSLTQSTD